MGATVAFIALLVTAATVVHSQGDGVPQISRPAGDDGVTSRTYSGYMADVFCVNRRIAVDGADMLTAPERHSLHCLLDIPQCYNNGFCLMQQSPSTGNWHCAYTFNNAETMAIRNHLNTNRVERRDLHVSVSGTWGIDGRMNVDVAAIQYTPRVVQAATTTAAPLAPTTTAVTTAAVDTSTTTPALSTTAAAAVVATPPPPTATATTTSAPIAAVAPATTSAPIAAVAPATTSAPIAAVAPSTTSAAVARSVLLSGVGVSSVAVAVTTLFFF